MQEIKSWKAERQRRKKLRLTKAFQKAIIKDLEHMMLDHIKYIMNPMKVQPKIEERENESKHS